MYLQDPLFACCELRPTPCICERPKSAIAAVIGARLRDVYPLRDDEADFADLLAALDLIPASRSIH
jgi:hypothetical protein